MKISSILIPLDLNNSNTELLKFGFKLSKLFESKLTFLNCTHSDPKKHKLEQSKGLRQHEFDSFIAEKAVLYNCSDYNCIVSESLPSVGILDELDNNQYSLLLMSSNAKSNFFTIKSIASLIIDKSSIQTIILPENFRFLDVNHVLFNIEFEFREIYKIYQLLDFCNGFNALLSCVHFCKRENKKEASDNLRTYKMLYESYPEDKLDFEIIVSDDLGGIEIYAKENEVDLIVVFKSRKTWKNQFMRPVEEKLSKKLSVPVFITDN